MKVKAVLTLLVLLSLLVLCYPDGATADELAQSWPRIYSQGPSTGRYIALTFDDVPMAGCEELLQILDELDVSATFFVEGVFAVEKPWLLSAIHGAGHELANHSYTHPDMTTLDDAEIYEELNRTNELIRSQTGVIPHLFRPPGGQYNQRVVDAAYGLEMVTVLWTVNTADYLFNDPSRIVSRIMDHVGSGANILMHDGVEATREALPEIVSTLRQQGYTFVTVGEMIELTYGECPWRQYDLTIADSYTILGHL